MNLRVAHILFPRRSTTVPVSQFSWDAVRALSREADLAVEILIPIPAAMFRALRNRLRRDAPPWPEDIEAILGARDPRPTFIPYLPLYKRSIESASLAIAAAMIARRPDRRPHVVHGSFLDEAGFAAAVVGRAINVASIAVAHGSDLRIARAGGDPAKSARVRRTLKDATEIITVTHELASMSAQFGRRAEVVRYTADPALFPLAPLPPHIGTLRVVFVGRIDEHKGVDVLLNAFATIARRDVELTMVGPASATFDVRAMIKTLGLVDRVKILPEILQSELPSIYASATCIAHASRAEGLPCVLAEALLVGRPVVATDVGGTRELVDSSVGELVPPNDPVRFARALEAVLERSERGAFPPEKMRAQVMPMTWTTQGRLLATVTRRAAGG